MRLIPLFLLAAAASGCGSDEVNAPEPRERGWSLVTSAPVAPAESYFRHEDVFFLDASRGWITNTAGQVFRTTDGAATWEQVWDEPQLGFRAIGFATAEHGWGAFLNRYTDPAPDSVLWETRDGGRTWENISSRITGPKPVGICGIHVLDENTIFAVGRWHSPAVFLKSTDGGRTWTSRELAPLAGGAVDVFFLNANVGFVTGGEGMSNSGEDQRRARAVVLRTTDGGETWTRVYRASVEGTWGWKLSFPTDRVGFMAKDGFGPLMVARTTDGGLTWTELIVSPHPGSFQGIGFVTPDSGWVGGQESVFETADGGATWQERELGRYVNRFRFLPNGDGFAVGERLFRFTR